VSPGVAPPPPAPGRRRVAALDLGTNTCLLLIAELDARAAPHVLAEHHAIPRLGAGVDRSGRLAPEAEARTLACLTEFRALLDRFQVEELECVGTSALRDAQGGAEFRARARALLGAELRVASGAEEAALTYFGAQSGQSLAPGAPLFVFDIGGGSTELIAGRAGDPVDLLRAGAPEGHAGGHSPLVPLPRFIAALTSVDIGSVRLTERFLQGSDAPEPSALRAAAAAIDAALDTAFETPGLLPGSGAEALGVAGTVTTLWTLARGAAEHQPERAHGERLGHGDVSAVLEVLSRRSPAERRALPGLEPGRADVIVAGALIAERILLRLPSRSCIVSDRGVRHGLLTRLAWRAAGGRLAADRAASGPPSGVPRPAPDLDGGPSWDYVCAPGEL
jgi:exopolyphosphatase/guanosine-5'-triphosphate,3'-diphosphate pyrophosphatase